MTPKNNKKQGKYASIAITVSIVFMLILSGPAGAAYLRCRQPRSGDWRSHVTEKRVRRRKRLPPGPIRSHRKS